MQAQKAIKSSRHCTQIWWLLHSNNLTKRIATETSSQLHTLISQFNQSSD